jgi:uroporphyrinogen decarboxylase
LYSRETILKAVYMNTIGMEPVPLKKDYGNEIVSPGGGADTRKMLPSGTVQAVKGDVCLNVDVPAAGGGFVFNTVHNIQAEKPTGNIMAVWKTLHKFGK